MSTKNSTIAITVILIGGGLLWYFYKNKKPLIPTPSNAPSNTKTLTDNALALITAINKDAGAEGQTPAAISAFEKYKNTIRSGILTTEELNGLSDAYLVYQNKYVGTTNPDLIWQWPSKIGIKYQIYKASEVVAPLNPDGSLPVYIRFV